MKADFQIYGATTVPKEYSWDLGTPLNGSVVTTTPAYTTETYISGYAPGVRVLFLNTSIANPNYALRNYTWNFDDYYNDEGNIVSLSCLSLAEHTYIMPGRYTVSLNMSLAEEQQQPDQNPNDLICLGKDNIRWFWDNVAVNSLSTVCIPWDQAFCTPLSALFAGVDYDKWWDDELKCFQKYCKLWSWEAMKQNFIFYSPQVRPDDPITDNPVRWRDTRDRQPFVKKWMYEANNKACVLDIINVVDEFEDTVTKVVVEVFEKPPTAGITCLTRPLTGYSPFTVLLSPTACKCGSFPIDKIDWDFGDGSPIKTITRYFSLTTDPDIIFNNIYQSDVLDVRNFDIKHTYHVNKNTYPVFYPSLTCYSANTNTSDSCSTTVGPILYAPVPQNVELIKAKNTVKGTIYAFNVEKNIVFTTTSTITSSPITIQKPSNKLKDSIYDQVPTERGYRGGDYPVFITPVCETTTIATNALITEDGNISRPEAPEDGPNIPVKTEISLDIIP